MRLESHKSASAGYKTVITIIHDAIEAWRKPLLKKRDDVADDIVKAHHAIGGVETTGIWIEPESNGRAEELRQKANADRIFRWLDDQEKEKNLLPVNFLPSLLAGLPMEVRIQCMNKVLAPCGLSVRPLVEETSEIKAGLLLNSMLKEGAEAGQAMAKLITSCNLSDLESAQKELIEAGATNNTALLAVQSEIAKARAKA